MDIENTFFVDLVAVMGAAFVGAITARLLRLPLLLGYLAAGVIIGPHVAGLITNQEDVGTIAEFGVVLLLFVVGIEISFRDLRKLGRVPVVAGVVQVAATVAVGYGVGVGFGWDVNQAVMLGLVISLSSTMVVLKTLNDRGELHSLHGRLLTGIMVVQDLIFVGMIAVIPLLGDDAGSPLLELGLGLLKATVALVAMAVFGSRIFPWLLRRVAGLGSREVFLLTVVAITFTSAALTQQVGLSAALGAFLAGLVLSESDFGHRALAEILPLRDAFASVFFVSLGMLADPAIVATDPGTLAAVVATVVIFKFAITAGLIRSLGYLPQTGLLVGLGMVQFGEFSFTLTNLAVDLGAVDGEFLSMIVTAAVLTMALTPGVVSGGTWLVDRLGRRFRLLQPYRQADLDADERTSRLRDHVIVVGMGRVGSLVAQSLRDRGIPSVGIDLDPRSVDQCREQGQPAINGSSSNEVVLRAARVEFAKVMVLATGDPISAYVTAQHALHLNPNLQIVARVHWREEGERLKTLGIDEVVWPEMEAGLEILRHTLLIFGDTAESVDLLVDDLRDHLAFGAALGQEDELPEEGLGPEPRSTAAPDD